MLKKERWIELSTIILLLSRMNINKDVTDNIQKKTYHWWAVVKYDVTYEMRRQIYTGVMACWGSAASEMKVQVDAGAFLIRDQSWYISFA